MKLKEEQMTDEEVVSRSLSESRYFDILYERYQGKVRDKCYGLLKDSQLVQEMTNLVFARVFENLPKFRQQSSFSTWLYTITYNLCIDYLREKKKMHYPSWNQANDFPEVSDEDDPAITAQVTYENLQTILETIHPEERALLLMKYQDDLSLKQISEALRISENAAKMRLKRARTRVQLLYNKKFPV